MRKKVFLLIIVLCVAISTGCGNKNTSNEASSSGEILDNQLPPSPQLNTEYLSSEEVLEEPLTFAQLESEIKKYLSMTTEEITRLTGCEIDKDGTYYL